MASIDDVIAGLKRLRPEQVNEVAKIVDRLSEAESDYARVVEEAVRHGWPAALFTDVIGSLPDLERAPQPSAEARRDL